MNATNQGIVLGYDGSADADLALRWAATTATQEDLPVKVVIVEDPESVPFASVERRHEYLQSLQSAAEIALKELGVAEAAAELVEGRPAAKLVEASRSATHVVVGSRGHNAFAESMIGSVSQELARRSSCPVVVVREPARPDADRIVVGIDGSPLSSAALEFACRRAEITGGVVVAIYGWRMGDLKVERSGNLPEEVGPVLDENELLLAEAVAGVGSEHPDVTLIKEAIPVVPKQALVDASRSASLVVVGSRGHGPLTGVVLGSVSHHVLRHAQCPVAVVR